MSKSSPELYIGLMSGTSMDGIDAALVEIQGSRVKLLQTHSHRWPQDLQQALIETRDIPDEELASLSELDLLTAEIFAEACLSLLSKTLCKSKNIRAIGSHGQTIRHRPDIDNPFSLQIGNAQKLAMITGIDVVSDFRTADIKAGGQGAPLVPAFHQAIFHSDEKNRVIVNIGGIANITVLPKDRSAVISGFDCGPGNTLMDAWIRKTKHKPYDADGAMAAKGSTDPQLLATLIKDLYFKTPPPKSTGFEYFNLQWLEQYLPEKTGTQETRAENVQSTLCDLTAQSIIHAIHSYAEETDEIFLCGGGASNKELTRRLQQHTSCPVQSTEVLGVHPDWVEAMAFAWLARQHVHGKSANLPSVTGANKQVILGHMTEFNPHLHKSMV